MLSIPASKNFCNWAISDSYGKTFESLLTAAKIAAPASHFRTRRARFELLAEANESTLAFSVTFAFPCATSRVSWRSLRFLLVFLLQSTQRSREGLQRKTVTTSSVGFVERSLHDVQTQLLCGMRREALASALASLDQSQILQRLRAAFAQSAPGSGVACSACVNQRRLRCGPNATTRAAAADY